MGMIVSVTKIPNSNDNDEEMFYEYSYDQEDYMLLELDDGTGTLPCLVPEAMMERLDNAQVGQTIDCIGEVQIEREFQTVFLQVDTLLEVVPRSNNNPTVVAEQLRWMEITHKDSIATCGYPCPNVTSESIFEIIDSNNPGEGVSVKDLALVLDMEPQEVKPLIEDLQLQGLIYENETGSFVPL